MSSALQKPLGTLFMPAYKSDALLLRLYVRAGCVNQDLYARILFPSSRTIITVSYSSAPWLELQPEKYYLLSQYMGVANRLPPTHGISRTRALHRTDRPQWHPFDVGCHAPKRLYPRAKAAALAINNEAPASPFYETPYLYAESSSIRAPWKLPSGSQFQRATDLFHDKAFAFSFSSLLCSALCFYSPRFTIHAFDASPALRDVCLLNDPMHFNFNI